MSELISSQLDFFDDFVTPDFLQSERIRKLEHQQEKLRKGLFRRWNEQEAKIAKILALLESND